MSCDQIGYQGRLGIYELIEMNEGMRRLVHDQASEDALTTEARKGSQSLMQNGFARVIAGQTTVDEVFRVTQT